MEKLSLYFPDTTYYAIVEYAHKWPDMRHGLMFREYLGRHEGMLFDFGDSKEKRSMWNHNVPIYLDMVFANYAKDGNGMEIPDELKIVDIVQNVEPKSKESVISKIPCRFVLELAGSTVEENDIRIGDIIEIE